MCTVVGTCCGKIKNGNVLCRSRCISPRWKSGENTPLRRGWETGIKPSASSATFVNSPFHVYLEYLHEARQDNAPLTWPGRRNPLPPISCSASSGLFRSSAGYFTFVHFFIDNTNGQTEKQSPSCKVFPLSGLFGLHLSSLRSLICICA